MEPHASNDLSSKWKLMKPCFPRDLGTQRCRFSPKLLHSLNVHVGNYVLVNLNTHWTLCCVYVWKNQNADCFQVDETVSLPLFQNGTRTKDPTSPKDLPQFTVLDVEPLKKISLTLVVRKYSDIAHSIQVRSRISDGLRDVLELYGVLDGCVIDCHHLVPCYLLNVCYVIVTHCHPRCLGKVGKVTPKTAIEIVKIMSKARYEALRANSKGIIGLGGLDKPRKLLHDLLTCPFRHRDDARRLGLLCPRGILLIGPPGTGKTSLVRAVVNECNASLVYLPGPIVCKPQPGESESVLRAIFGVAQELSREGPCVLFLDEVDSILANRELARGGNQHGRLLAQMLTLMDSVRATENLVIVGATNRPDVLDPAVRRPGRFDQEVYIGAPTKWEREHILRVLTSKLPLHENVKLDDIADRTPGFVGADLADLCQKIILSKISLSNKELVITQEDFENAMLLARPSIQRGLLSHAEFQPTPWDAIGGLRDVKNQLRQSLEWPIKHAAAFKRLGIDKPKGVLLYGPPGCCKTTLVKAAATACHASFLSASAAEIYSPYVGDSEKALEELFHKGRLTAPTILFLDEIDSIVGKRNAVNHRGVHEKVLSTLLNEMDGIGIKFDANQGSGQDVMLKNSNNQVLQNTSVDEVGHIVVVAATNRPDLIDEAVIRPGRFDKIIFVPPPDKEMRIEILKVLTQNMPISDFDFEDIAQKTHLCSGADLENLCREAALYALSTDGFLVSKVLHQHFLFALQKMKPSLSDDQLRFYEALNQKPSFSA